MLTVKQLSKLAGVTPRTLRHYDSIGLLRPSHVGRNGYRYYEEEAVLRLQQILFYRELDLALVDIKKIVGRRDFDVLVALQGHRDALNQQVSRLNRLIQTVDKTILHLKGRSAMSEQDFFAGFSDAEQEKYAQEAMQMYDPNIVKGSMRKWKAYGSREKQQIGEEGKAVYMDFLAAIPNGPNSPEAQAAVARWQRHIEYFWKPNDEQLLGLVDLYNNDARFRGNFDKLSPTLAGFMREAVRAFVQARKKAR
ncbi:MAG TPA: MerR family transcriptional regulator [Anaerolineales bacterium]